MDAVPDDRKGTVENVPRPISSPSKTPLSISERTPLNGVEDNRSPPVPPDEATQTDTVQGPNHEPLYPAPVSLVDEVGGISKDAQDDAPQVPRDVLYAASSGHHDPRSPSGSLPPEDTSLHQVTTASPSQLYQHSGTPFISTTLGNPQNESAKGGDDYSPIIGHQMNVSSVDRAEDPTPCTEAEAGRSGPSRGHSQGVGPSITATSTAEQEQMNAGDNQTQEHNAKGPSYLQQSASRLVLQAIESGSFVLGGEHSDSRSEPSALEHADLHIPRPSGVQSQDTLETDDNEHYHLALVAEGVSRQGSAVTQRHQYEAENSGEQWHVPVKEHVNHRAPSQVYGTFQEGASCPLASTQSHQLTAREASQDLSGDVRHQSADRHFHHKNPKQARMPNPLREEKAWSPPPLLGLTRRAQRAPTLAPNEVEIPQATSPSLAHERQHMDESARPQHGTTSPASPRPLTAMSFTENGPPLLRKPGSQSIDLPDLSARFARETQGATRASVLTRAKLARKHRSIRAIADYRKSSRKMPPPLSLPFQRPDSGRLPADQDTQDIGGNEQTQDVDQSGRSWPDWSDRSAVSNGTISRVDRWSDWPDASSGAPRLASEVVSAHHGASVPESTLMNVDIQCQTMRQGFWSTQTVLKKRKSRSGAVRRKAPITRMEARRSSGIRSKPPGTKAAFSRQRDVTPEEGPSRFKRQRTNPKGEDQTMAPPLDTSLVTAGGME